MNLIENLDIEEKKIYEWASKYQNKEWLKADWKEDIEGYFSNFNNDGNVEEYTFSTVDELRRLLEKQWENDNDMKEIIIPCAVAMYKAREKVFEKESMKTGSDKIQKDEFVIPDYVYVF